MEQEFVGISNNFGIWLKLLDKEMIAEKLNAPWSRIYRYSRMTREELMTRLTLFDVLALEKYVNELGFDFTDAPNVHKEKTYQVKLKINRRDNHG